MTNRPPRPLLWLGGLLAVYLGYPLLAFAVRVAGGGQEGWNVPGLWPAVGVSVISSSAALLIGVITGVPLAYVLARRNGRLSAAVGALVQLPLALPPLITGIILIYVAGPYSFLGRLSGQRLTETIWGLIIAQSFVSIPFLVVVARSAFRSVDPTLGEVAASLGHGPLARFLRVDVPAASDGIRTGMILMWLRAFGEFGTVVILAYHPYSLPVYVDNLFSSGPLSQAEAPTVLAFVVAVAAIALSTLRRLPRLGAGERRQARAQPLAPLTADAAPVAFDLTARAGEFSLRIAQPTASRRLAVVGPSGSGKSLTLRALAGVVGAVGSVRCGGIDFTRLDPEQRRSGYVPQGYGLIPGRTVWEQICFGLHADGARAAWWLERLELASLAERLPHQLSGGQRQRVSLARALASDPRLLLLDEPFSALDAPVRARLQRELRALQRETGLTTVLVTHDPQEAAMLADDVLVIADGRVLQAGPVGEVFRYPASTQVASLLGLRNVGTGTITLDGRHVQSGDLRLAVADAPRAGTQVLWSVPMEQVQVDPVPLAGGGAATRPGATAGVVLDVIDLGTCVEVVVALAGRLELAARSTAPAVTRSGDPCQVRIEPDAVRSWPAAAEARTPASAGQR